MHAFLMRPPFPPHRVRMDGRDGAELHDVVGRCLSGRGKVIEGRGETRKDEFGGLGEGHGWFDFRQTQ